jgi:hypothetical protein
MEERARPGAGLYPSVRISALLTTDWRDQGCAEAARGAPTKRTDRFSGYVSALEMSSHERVKSQSASGVRALLTSISEEMNSPAVRSKASSKAMIPASRHAAARTRSSSGSSARRPAPWYEHQPAGAGDLPRPRRAGPDEHEAVALEQHERLRDEVRARFLTACYRPLPALHERPSELHCKSRFDNCSATRDLAHYPQCYRRAACELD